MTNESVCIVLSAVGVGVRGWSCRLLRLFFWFFFYGTNLLLMFFFMFSHNLLFNFGALSLRNFIKVMLQFCLNFGFYLLLLSFLGLYSSIKSLLLFRDEESDAALFN